MSDKFVLIKHTGTSLYLFRVPSHLELFAGDHVICDTRRGRMEGMCMCDSFITEKGDMILDNMGIKRTMLRDVVDFVDGIIPSRFSDAEIPDDVELPFEELFF